MQRTKNVSVAVAFLLTLAALGTSLSNAAAEGLQPSYRSTDILTSFQNDAPWWAEDSNSYETDEPWWAEDSGSYETDEPWWATDEPSSETDRPWWAEDTGQNEPDTPWWAEGNGTRPTNIPWWAEETCIGDQCQSGRAWWDDEVTCFGAFCNDDPWEGSTQGCSFGICEDDSFLVDCSYVTVSGAGAEGACEGPLGQSRFDNCYPVWGSGALSGANQQTFRCSDATGYQTGGYPLIDIAPRSSDDVVLVLCADGGVAGALGPESCEDAPRNISYYTCEKDRRMIPPSGSNMEWYVCER